jgi:hypothetical protein
MKAIFAACALAAAVVAPAAFAQDAPQDHAAVAASQARAEDYVATVRAELERLDAVAADPAHPRHGDWAQFQRAAGETGDPIVRELLQRTARDQFLRHVATGALYEDPSILPEDTGPISRELSRDTFRQDMDNLDWLKPVVAQRGWFTIGGDGAAAARAAWYLAMHASIDRQWQEQALALMEPLAKSGEVDRNDYAMLFDRVALMAGRPTRYGTQGMGCSPDGQRYQFAPVEDPEQLDARRAEMGIPPFAESAAGADRRCLEAARR